MVPLPDKRLVVGFERKGPAKSLVALQHGKLPDQAAATRMKAFWTERLAELGAMLATPRSIAEERNR